MNQTSVWISVEIISWALFLVNHAENSFDFLIHIQLRWARIHSKSSQYLSIHTFRMRKCASKAETNIYIHEKTDELHWFDKSWKFNNY